MKNKFVNGEIDSTVLFNFESGSIHYSTSSTEASRTMSSENLPKWVAEEIRNAKFDQAEEWSGSGYILDVNKDENKVDVQFYEKLPEGRYIATLDLASDINPETLELAIVYMFKFRASKATLAPKVVTFLKEKYNVQMDSIYKFELLSVEKLDAEADARPPGPSEAEDEDEE
jgi:hypothetical protein